jgi:hypothetical protein
MRKWFINFLHVFFNRKRTCLLFLKQILNMNIVAKTALSEQILESQAAVEMKEQDCSRELLDFHISKVV